MFCKFCGEEIDRTTMKCSVCGKKAGPLEGGVGFWDLAGQPAPAAADIPDAVPEDETEYPEYPDEPRQEDPAGIIWKILPIAAIALAMILAVLNIKLWLDIWSLRQEQTQLHAQLQQITRQLDTIQAEPTPAETTLPTQSVPETDSLPQETTGPVSPEEDPRIVSQPENHTLFWSEFDDKDGEKVFCFTVSGEVLTAVWEKRDLAGNWIPVDDAVFESSPEPDYVSGQTTLILLLKSRTTGIEGTYHCCVTFLDGTTLNSEEVQLTVES